MSKGGSQSKGAFYLSAPSEGHQSHPNAIFFFFLLILVGYMGIFLAALVIKEIFYQFSVRIVPHINVFCCVCWGRQAACPSTPLS